LLRWKSLLWWKSLLRIRSLLIRSLLIRIRIILSQCFLSLKSFIWVLIRCLIIRHLFYLLNYS
jgi:hypothetical protein